MRLGCVSPSLALLSRDPRRRHDRRGTDPSYPTKAQTEYLYPQLADRGTYDDWKENGKRDAYEIAHEKVAKILSEHYPVYIDPAADARIREHFPITLKPEDMKPGNGRW